jgi:hypothetical protein
MKAEMLETQSVPWSYPSREINGNLMHTDSLERQANWARLELTGYYRLYNSAREITVN